MSVQPGYVQQQPLQMVQPVQPVYAAPVMAAPVVAAPAVTVLTQPGGLGSCQHLSIRNEATGVGLLLAIFCFPLGIIFCVLTMQKKCNNCGILIG